MADVNKVFLLGRLGSDVEVKQVGKSHLANATMATNGWKDKEGNVKTTWHNLIFWGKTAQIAGDLATKGQQIYVEGEIEHTAWEKDGVKRTGTQVKVNNFQVFNRGEGKTKAATRDAFQPDFAESDIPF